MPRHPAVLTHHAIDRAIERLGCQTRSDAARTLHFFHLDDETVWGATARILVDLLERVLVGEVSAPDEPR